MKFSILVIPSLIVKLFKSGIDPRFGGRLSFQPHMPSALAITGFLALITACSSVSGPASTPGSSDISVSTAVPTLTSIPTQDPSGPPRIAYMSNRDGPFDVFIMDHIGNNVINLTKNAASDGVPTNSGTGITFLSDREQGALAFYEVDFAGEQIETLISVPVPKVGNLYWSNDWSQAAFVSGPDESQDVYLYDRATGSIRNLTESNSRDRFGDWSPDGSQILFTSTREGDRSIYLLDLADGKPVRLTDSDVNSINPAWSPDGQKIAFASDRDQDVEIYSMDIDGGNILRLTNAAEFDGFPKWSPDGQKIAFLSYRAGNGEIFSMAPDGSDQINLTQTAEEESRNGEFSWSPDGNQILFISGRDGNPDIFTMNSDGSDPLNLTFFPSDDILPVWVYE